MTTTNIIKVTLPTSAIEVAKMQAEIEKDAPFLLTTEVVTAIDYSDADEILTDVVRKKDALVAMRKRATEPLKASAKEIESWFAPAVRTLCEVESFLKGKMGAYHQRLAEAKAAASSNVARAAEAHDAPALLEAMASVPVAARTTIGSLPSWRHISMNSSVPKP